ncbi:MAG: N-acetyltransferase [Alphaproteobacteria bacterium]|nr:N-acetyltransferase [Rhodospirillaceae bacterium]MDG2481280.1 N-acetyltransferase [Alphaproteobacteria bacterium]MBT6205671.1 N-acetyltransferase [Rhodospirillaceae bacterium]MBT6509298.1 N-acetyltransferase [Rhodospirillaceae bacterium]MBT7613331.1 N-acetyltransferase [Rhodospirillaceae bacterium]
MFSIIEERASDHETVVKLARLSLGNRFTDSPAARMRAGTTPVPGLSMIVLENDKLVGTIRYWPILIGAGTKAIQLGPVAIEPDHRGRGFSRILIRYSLERAQALGHRIAVLIGNPALYGRYGFEPALPRDIVLPETEDRDRLQVMALAPGALDGLSGAIRPDTIPSLTSNRLTA